MNVSDTARHLLPIVLPALLLAGLTGCPQVEPAAPGATVAAQNTPLGPGVVVIEAPISHMVLQHPMSADPALMSKSVSYVKVDGNEVSVYADTRIACPAKVRLTGKWGWASGDKGGQHHVHSTFVADRWECVP